MNNKWSFSVTFVLSKFFLTLTVEKTRIYDGLHFESLDTNLAMP